MEIFNKILQRKKLLLALLNEMIFRMYCCWKNIKCILNKIELRFLHLKRNRGNNKRPCDSMLCIKETLTNQMHMWLSYIFRLNFYARNSKWYITILRQNFIIFFVRYVLSLGAFIGFYFSNMWRPLAALLYCDSYEKVLN